MSLKDKVALITGVGGQAGIGFAIAKKLGQAGAIMGIAAISNDVYERGKELQSLGYAERPFRLDLTKFDDVKTMTEDLLRDRGRILLRGRAKRVHRRRQQPPRIQEQRRPLNRACSGSNPSQRNDLVLDRM